MVDHIIKMDTPAAIAVPNRKIGMCPMKKWVMPTDRTTRNVTFDSDQVVRLRWTPYIDMDPNGYFTEVEFPTPSGDPAEGPYTAIRVNHNGFYMFTCRFTVFGDNPVQDNASTFEFMKIMSFGDFAGFTPTYSTVSIYSKMLGTGTYPSAVSSLGGDKIYGLSTGNDNTVYVGLQSSKTVAGGPDRYKDTYLQGVYLGLQDANVDPYYQNQGRTR